MARKPYIKYEAKKPGRGHMEGPKMGKFFNLIFCFDSTFPPLFSKVLRSPYHTYCFIFFSLVIFFLLEFNNINYFFSRLITSPHSSHLENFVTNLSLLLSSLPIDCVVALFLVL